VGPNGSAKTNFIELFKFLKNALVGGRRPYAPYLEWWSYRNIVWEGNERLPIRIKLICEIEGYNLEYTVSFGRMDGVFRILNEQLVIEKVISLEREGLIIKIRFDENFIRENARKINNQLKEINRFVDILTDGKLKLSMKNLSEQILKVPVDFDNLLFPEVLGVPYRIRGRLIPELISTTSREAFAGNIALVCLYAKNGVRVPLRDLLHSLRSAIRNFTILKHPNMKELKSPSSPKGTQVLLDDASNVTSILYQWFSEKRRLPERIETTISELFPDTQVGFGITSDGKIFVKIHEKGVELNPPCLPDGLYKVLAVLTAVESKPSVLAIDEIENSLYKEALENVLDELRESESTVIITTHSPLVVDMVRLEDLLIAEKTAEETIMIRIKDPEKIREKLSKLKITQSESWLYGDISG